MKLYADLYIKRLKNRKKSSKQAKASFSNSLKTKLNKNYSEMTHYLSNTSSHSFFGKIPSKTSELKSSAKNSDFCPIIFSGDQELDNKISHNVPEEPNSVAEVFTFQSHKINEKDGSESKFICGNEGELSKNEEVADEKLMGSEDKLNGLNNVKSDTHSRKGRQNVRKYTKDEIISNTNAIFIYHAFYNKSTEEYLLSYKSFIKIIKKLNIVPFSLSVNDIYILIKSICGKSNSINYDQFIEILLKITERIYPYEFSQEAKLIINYFFHNLFVSFSFIISEVTELHEKSVGNKDSYRNLMSFVGRNPTKSQILVIENVSGTVIEIYKMYFDCEIKVEKLARKELIGQRMIKSTHENSLKSLLLFAKEFEVLPYIVNETQVVTYFNLVINQELYYNFFGDCNNLGFLFTVNHFILFLIHMSYYNYCKFYDENIDNNCCENYNKNDINIDNDNIIKSPTNKNIDSNVKNNKNTIETNVSGGLNSVKCSSESKGLLIFLNVLQCSKGMRKVYKRKKSENIKFSLVPDKEIYVEIGEMNSDNGFGALTKKESQYFIEKMFSEGNEEKNCERMKELGRRFNFNDGSERKERMILDEGLINQCQLLRSHIKEIEDTFIFFIGFSDRNSDHLNIQMNLTSYIKFLKHCKIVSEPKKKKFFKGKKKTDLKLTETNLNKGKYSFSYIKSPLNLEGKTNSKSISLNEINIINLKNKANYKVYSNLYNVFMYTCSNFNGLDPLETQNKRVKSESHYYKEKDSGKINGLCRSNVLDKVKGGLKREELGGHSSVLSESEVNLIFTYLTGPRNIDKTKYYSNMLNKNKGYLRSGRISNREFKALNNNISDHCQSATNNTECNIVNRLSFNKFLLSFELLAQKLYPFDGVLMRSLNRLLEEKILPNLIMYKNKNDCMSFDIHSESEVDESEEVNDIENK